MARKAYKKRNRFESTENVDQAARALMDGYRKELIGKHGMGPEQALAYIARKPAAKKGEQP